MRIFTLIFLQFVLLANLKAIDINPQELKLSQVEQVITTDGEKIPVRGNILKVDYFSGSRKSLDDLNFLELKNNRVIYSEEIKNIILRNGSSSFMMREGVSGGG